ncbi:MAG: NAD-dependent epimerase/dehydratase family protein, partial [Stellaceae bacterium]
MRHRRAAVLGGSGFIGRYIVKRLAAQGVVVTVGCRHAEEARFLQPMGNVGQIAVINLSIGDEALLPDFLAGNDALVNCAGILYERGAQRFDLVHHSGPARLARLAREAGVER